MGAFFVCILTTMPTFAQDQAPPPKPIIFTPGTGTSTPSGYNPPAPPRPVFACSGLPSAVAALLKPYEPPVIRLTVAQVGLPMPVPPPPPKQRLDQILLKTALDSYAFHNCRAGQLSGPAVFIVIDFAKVSTEPRLYKINMTKADGIDTPVLVAHGIGSDPDDDGVAQSFGNWQDSLMSSLGAARGAEIYYGINGRSLRLDGLDPSNSAMRARDIVAHSYRPELYRYFNASLRASRGGRPGTSEGCFVVEPHLRDWLFDQLVGGGFLYAGLGGARGVDTAPKTNKPVVTFVSGTGKN